MIFFTSMLLYWVLPYYRLVVCVIVDDNWKDPDPFEHSNIAIKGCTKNEECQNDKYCGSKQGCLSEAKCTEGYCECPPGKFGWRCQYSTCTDYRFCQNGGDCMVVNNTHVCACPPDTSGELCENRTCMEEYNCNGVCASNNECKCDDKLEKTENDASPHCVAKCEDVDPCANNGECSVVDSLYKCKCPNGFHGPRCEFADCKESWCINGDCYEKECFCYPGYYGRQCNQASCDDFQGCFNSGRCSMFNNTIKCECDEKQFSGTYCEVECNPSCPEKSVCGTDGRCYCDEGYIGPKCEALFHAITVPSSPYVHGVLIGIFCIAVVAGYWTVMKRREPVLEIVDLNTL